MGSPRNTPKIIKFASNRVYTTSLQRPCSVHTTLPWRLYSVHDAATVRRQLLQRVHGAHTSHPQRSHGAHSVLTAIIAFKLFYLFILFGNPILQKVIYFFRRKLSKRDFDLHFCIMTSVWDFSNPPFYWMIS